jgi:hypothetical protein
MEAHRQNRKDLTGVHCFGDLVHDSMNQKQGSEGLKAISPRADINLCSASIYQSHAMKPDINLKEAKVRWNNDLCSASI